MAGGKRSVTSKKSKHSKDEAFSLDVSNAIRHHTGERKALESKRVIAFEDRDAALEEKNELDDKGSDAYLEACRRHSDAIGEIDRLSSQIKWHRNQIDELVEKADEPQLDFMYEPPVEPVKKDPRQMKLGDGLGQGEKKADTRPVGRPGPVKPAAPSPEMGVAGVDEHLQASVNELDIREDLKGLLIKSHMPTVNVVVGWMEKSNGTNPVGTEAENLASGCDGIDLKGAKAICKAVKAFRAAHRNAILEKERGE
jgi:hypothetical protein